MISTWVRFPFHTCRKIRTLTPADRVPRSSWLWTFFLSISVALISPTFYIRLDKLNLSFGIFASNFVLMYTSSSISHLKNVKYQMIPNPNNLVKPRLLIGDKYWPSMASSCGFMAPFLIRFLKARSVRVVLEPKTIHTHWEDICVPLQGVWTKGSGQFIRSHLVCLLLHETFIHFITGGCSGLFQRHPSIFKSRL